MSFLKPKVAKSTQTSLSENVNNPLITSAFGGQMNQGIGANNFLAQLLGIQPDNGAQAGYNNYLQMAGYAPAMRQLSQNITGQQAGAGMLHSGATLKALQDRGAELNHGFYNNYLQQLAGLSGSGLQAGGLIANSGQRSTSSGTSTGGGPSTFGSIASAVGGIGSAIAPFFSDRRLKRDIVKEDEFEDGLGVYSFRYAGEAERQIGVMADEVEKIRPWALGPKKAGYATVDYARL